MDLTARPFTRAQSNLSLLPYKNVYAKHTKQRNNSSFGLDITSSSLKNIFDETNQQEQKPVKLRNSFYEMTQSSAKEKIDDKNYSLSYITPNVA